MRSKVGTGAKRLLRFATARRLLRQQDGAAAVEFGLVAAPFLALVFAIVETAIVFFAGQALETAAADGARLIMTGQAQNAGYDQTKFKEAVCAKIYGLFNCNGGLSIDVKNYPSWSG
jgi:Flp pilus assembly protein TadG